MLITHPIAGNRDLVSRLPHKLPEPSRGSLFRRMPWVERRWTEKMDIQFSPSHPMTTLQAPFKDNASAGNL